MIAGIGVDIIEVNRVIEKVNKGQGFKEQIFSVSEIAYCESRTNKEESFAARFAAKEAFLKAAGIGLTAGYSLADIEIVSEESGKPKIILHGSYKELAEKNLWTEIHLSLSHILSTATAFVIIEK